MERLKTVLSWNGDWTGLRDPIATRKRKSFLESVEARKIKHVASRVADARAGRMLLAKEIAWPIIDELQMIGDIEVTSNPLALLRLADTPGDNRLVMRRRFEALCLFDLGLIGFELERIDPMRRVEDDVLAMIGLLEEFVFSGDTQELDVHTYHDAEEVYRVKGISYDVATPEKFPKLAPRKHYSLCRITNRGIVLQFDVRAKDRFRTVVKLLKQAERPKENQDPLLVKDRCGLKFVVQSLEEVNALVEELRWHLEACDAVVVADGDNLTVDTGTAADPSNPHSSSKYKMKQLSVFWRGRWYEFQIVTFANHYSALYSQDEENHVLYKLKQVGKDVFSKLFLGNLYLGEGRWDDPALKQMLYDRQIQNLGWFHERQKRNGNGSKL